MIILNIFLFQNPGMPEIHCRGAACLPEASTATPFRSHPKKICPLLLQPPAKIIFPQRHFQKSFRRQNINRQSPMPKRYAHL